jgi:ATP-dependent helicase Lhr and Lhr-like helicase
LTTDANPTVESDPLAPFSGPVRGWFESSFEGPTPAQAEGWEAISSGANALICAPTGSGKTLAAFLWGIDRLTRREDLTPGVRLVYVSPLKALSYDIERNLRAPLRGIGADISVGLRTGDTSQADRRAMRRHPPDILITTPESLYLMLSSGAREILATAEAVIVDEIHAVAQSKRGSHLALTLERLDHLAREGSGEDSSEQQRGGSAEPSPDSSIQRIGLSATQRPLDRIARFLVGPRRDCRIVDAGRTKDLDLEIVVPVEDMADPGAPAFPSEDGTPPEGEPLVHVRSIWPAIYPELLKLVKEHTSTIIFVNARRAAERLAKRLNELAADEVWQELPASEHAGNNGQVEGEDSGSSAGGGGGEKNGLVPLP